MKKIRELTERQQKFLDVLFEQANEPTFENLNSAKKSLKILLKQLDQLKTKEKHTFIITPDCKLYSAKEIYL